MNLPAHWRGVRGERIGARHVAILGELLGTADAIDPAGRPVYLDISVGEIVELAAGTTAGLMFGRSNTLTDLRRLETIGFVARRELSRGRFDLTITGEPTRDPHHGHGEWAVRRG